MKNIMSYLIVVFSLLSFQLAHAIPSSCEDGSVKLTDLKFVGEPLISVMDNSGARGNRTCRVVSGSTDDEAKRECPSFKNGKATGFIRVNPGNPQYITGHGNTAIENSLGYYFCMTGFNKKKMCDRMTEQKSGSFIVEYTGKIHTNNDGDCKCRPLGSKESGAVDCPADPSYMEKENVTSCDVTGATQVGGKCVCSTDNNIEAKQGVTCPPAQSPPVSPTATVKAEDFEGCFAEIETASAACSQKGQDAFDKCSKNAPELNQNVSEAQRVGRIALDALVAKNAGTGALEACAKMSAAGTGVIEALSLFQKTCRGELDKCKKGCEEVKAYSQEEMSKLAEACEAKFKTKNPGRDWTQEHQNQFAALAQPHKDYAKNINNFCKGDVQVAEGQFDDMLKKLAESVQKADICKCQLTAGSTGDSSTCDSIVTPLTCMQNLNQPGCSFSSVGCPPGSTAVNCRTPVTAINPNGSGLKAPPSGFAGPGFGSAGGGTAGGKVQIGDVNENDFYRDETRPTGSGTATADGGSPFGVAPGGGAPGVSVNMGGGDGAGNGANGEGSEKGGLSGFFQNAKGAISSMFGGANGDKGAAAKTPNSKAYKNDVNGFRPKAPALRGMANAGEFGGKNRDIWKIMNQRYNDQYHTFITVETPSK